VRRHIREAACTWERTKGIIPVRSIVAIAYPAIDAAVPNIRRKPLGEVIEFL
jgi:hypothetical protein